MFVGTWNMPLGLLASPDSASEAATLAVFGMLWTALPGQVEVTVGSLAST